MHTGYWILIIFLCCGLFLFLGALIFCDITPHHITIEVVENRMINKDVFLKQMRELSNLCHCHSCMGYKNES